MTTIGIIQSNFIPWRGYFDFIHEVDTFVVLDDVQYTRRDWRNRNRIPRRNGGWNWLTVPVQHKSGQTIREVLIDESWDWRARHLAILADRYCDAPHRPLVYDIMSEAYARPFERLCELNEYLIQEIAFLLGVDTQFVRSSDLATRSGKNARLISIVQKLNGTRYSRAPAVPIRRIA